MASTDVQPELDTTSLSGSELRRLRKGARGAGPASVSIVDNPDKDVPGKRAAVTFALGRETTAKGTDKAKAKADREAAEAELTAELAKPDTVEV
jgi:hypothetical protein